MEGLRVEPRSYLVAPSLLEVQDIVDQPTIMLGNGSAGRSSYVEAVARNANFTRAAAELHVAQPALSVAIRRLEAELGVRLFERTSRRVSLTPAGTAFLDRASARQPRGRRA